MAFHLPRAFMALFFLLVLHIAESSPTSTYGAVIVGNYYAVVIDAGSTGSRSFVFNITETLSNERSTEENIVNQRPERHIISIARKKERPGLSTFGTSSSHEIVNYIAQFLIDAASVIPDEYHSTTQVFIKGTAGMRLLDEIQQEHIWTSLYEGLPAYETAGKKAIPFPILQQNLGIISGHSEAFYAVLSSNFIEGSIDSNLNPVSGKTMVGAMDMGGSSTQLVFFNGSAANEPISQSSFWSHSWLNFGVEIIKEKVLSHVLERHIAAGIGESTLRTTEVELPVPIDRPTGTISDDSQVQVVLDNPCGQADHEHDHSSGYLFRGTADVEYCMEIIQSVVWPAAPSIDSDDENNDSSALVQCSYPEGVCAVDNIKHPSIGDQRFYGMSVYYYAFDCVRQLGSQQLSSWPQPSISELRIATKDFCSMNWNELLEKFNGEDRHKYTRSTQLPFRCLEALYMLTLLERGFGFPSDSRQITLALEVQGREVEWTLGFVLAEIRNPLEGSTSSSPQQQEQQQEFDVEDVFEKQPIATKALESSWLTSIVARFRYVKEKVAAIAAESRYVFPWVFQQLLSLSRRLWDKAKAALEVAISKTTNSKFVF